MADMTMPRHVLLNKAEQLRAQARLSEADAAASQSEADQHAAAARKYISDAEALEAAAAKLEGAA